MDSRLFRQESTANIHSYKNKFKLRQNKAV